MRCIRIQCFTATVFLLAVYLFFFHKVWFTDKYLQTSVVLPNVIVHIDLKVPPKLKYLESLLPMFKKHGVTGLLMEYDDMFPYEGILVNISARNCYGKYELTRFLKKAYEYNLQIIPLIQTFGHLEHVLKLNEFRHLREDPKYPDSLCPSKSESRDLIKHMLEQVINFHTAITRLSYIHVGCDEVFQINKCELCVAKKFFNTGVFIEHIKFLSEYLREKIPHTTVLIWDDMLRSSKPEIWNINANNIEPVYWNYGPNLSVTHRNLLNYQRNFNSIWIASAFKGADGSTATIPSIRNRVLNHFSWMKLILNYKFGGESRVYNFKGIILTGWSRYSHMNPPCELLPVAIPSMILNLILVNKFMTEKITNNDKIDDFFIKYIHNDYRMCLECNKDSENDFDLKNLSNCKFESYDLYDLLNRFEFIKVGIAFVFQSDEIPLSSFEYYASKKFIDMTILMNHIKLCDNTLNKLIEVELALSKIMRKYYGQEVIDEYVNYKTYSLKKELEVILKALNGYKSTFVWNRNPQYGNVSGLLF